MKNEREIICEARTGRVPRLARILIFVILLTALTVPAFAATDLKQYQSYWGIPIWSCNDEDTIQAFNDVICPIDGMFLSIPVGEKTVYIDGVPSVSGYFTCSVFLEMKSGALVHVEVPVHVEKGEGKPYPIITAQPKAVVVKAGSYAEFYADGYNWDWCAWRFYDLEGEEVIFDVIQKRFPQVTTEGGNSTRFVVRNIPAEMNGWTACCLFATDKWNYSEKAVITVEGSVPAPEPTVEPVPTAAPEPAPASTTTTQEFVTTSNTSTTSTSATTTANTTTNTGNAEHVVLAQTSTETTQQRTAEVQEETCCFCEFLKTIKGSPVLLLILILLIVLLILRLLMFRRLTRAARKNTVEEVVVEEGSGD